MKKIIILFALAFLIPNLSFAGIPITDVVVEKNKVEKKVLKSDEDGKPTKHTKLVNRLYKKIQKKINRADGNNGGPATLNWLAFVFSILGLLLLFVSGVSILFLIAGLVLGIIGVKKKRPLQGLGIAAIAISGLFILLFLLAIVLVIGFFL